MDTTGYTVALPAQTHYSPLAFYRQNEALTTPVFNILGHAWTDPFSAVAWGYNTVAGKSHRTLKENYFLSGDEKERLLPYLLAEGWAEGLQPPAGNRDHSMVMAALTGATETLIRNQLAAINDPTVVHRYRWALTGERLRTEADGSLQELFAALSPDARNHPFIQEETDKDNPLATEYLLTIYNYIKVTNGQVHVGQHTPSGDTAPSVPGAPLRLYGDVILTLPSGRTVMVVNAPAIERPGKVPAPNSTSIIKHTLKHYRHSFHRGDKITLEFSRPALRAAAASEMEFQANDPTLDIRGHSLPIAKADYKSFVIPIINEKINMLSKGLQELVNSTRPKSSPLTSGQLRKLLDAHFQAGLTGSSLQNLVAQAAMLYL